MPSKKCSVVMMLSMVWVAFGLWGCDESRPPASPMEVTAPRALSEHTKEFAQEVIKVTDGVWVAVGFGLANSILLEGDDGLVIVDAMETEEEARAVKAAFREVSQKPIVAIIYTHNHADHIFGAKGFIEQEGVDVYAHETTSYYIDRVVNVIRPILRVRSARMFGSHLTGEAHENAGIGPHLGIDSGSTLDIVKPNKTFADEMAVTIAGIPLRLVHAPGETDDQLFVWLPEKRVLLPGDNIYKTFPNLYTIRGTAYRDVIGWAKSIDKMRQLRPAFVVPSHTRPIVGESTVQQVLTDYRDAIQFVHDQTVYWMNRGLTPDEIVERVQLPAHLKASPYLNEFYGQVNWSVRSVFSGYLGWFDGNPSTLNPLPPTQKAAQMAMLAGGEKALFQQAASALAAKQYQWALELTDYLKVLSVQPSEVRAIRRQSLLAMGQAESNPNARHYYLTQAQEASGDFHAGIDIPITSSMVQSLPLDGIFQSMSVNLNIAKAGDMQRVINFRFPDVDQQYSLSLRVGVLEVQPYLQPDPDITVTLPSTVWKEVAAKITNPLVAFASGDIEIEGSKMALIEFLSVVVSPDTE